jgi:hypothetical protein
VLVAEVRVGVFVKETITMREKVGGEMPVQKTTFKFGRPHFKTWSAAEPIFAPSLADALSEVKNHADQFQQVQPNSKFSSRLAERMEQTQPC